MRRKNYNTWKQQRTNLRRSTYSVQFSNFDAPNHRLQNGALAAHPRHLPQATTEVKTPARNTIFRLFDPSAQEDEDSLHSDAIAETSEGDIERLDERSGALPAEKKEEETDT